MEEVPYLSSLLIVYNGRSSVQYSRWWHRGRVLAIQVAESIEKLKVFYGMIQSTLADIFLLINEIEALNPILEDIEISFQNELFLNPRTKGVVMRSYTLCLSSARTLEALAKDLEQGMMFGK